MNRLNETIKKNDLSFQGKSHVQKEIPPSFKPLDYACE